ncbi:MAG TPA: helix-turn-helix domain-containing protein [Kofleriaceae bacterium]|nr:helix-turn-helix domain-containing protein [Kofleriaceae bacterium]
MARWEPNASGRLTEAAMALFAERGYANTTVADIAARAGLTERTFFNHFADKREVLFAGSEQFVAMIVEALRAAPAELAPLDAVVAAYEATSDFFQQRHAFARKRAELIAAHPELQERELIKMMSVAAAVREVLQQRGVSAAAATLAAEAGNAILRVGFEQWTSDAHDRSLAFHLRAARRQLEAVVISPAASRGGRAGTRATSAGGGSRSRSRGDRDR